MYSDRTRIVIPLVGAPNSGKTTLFNWLTAAKFRTVNYPGATVDYAIGTSAPRYGEAVEIMDTPGTYSFSPKSPEEEVTRRILFRRDGTLTDFKIPLVIAVVDATQMDKHLHLVYQLKAARFPTIVAVTMKDLLDEEQVLVDWEKMSRILDCPVIPIDGRLGGGVDELLESVRAALPVAEDPLLQKLEPNTPMHWDSTAQETTHRDVESLLQQVRKENKNTNARGAFARTGQLDRIILHERWGLFFLGTIMVLLFSSIFWLAAPLMDLVDQGFSGLALLAEKLLGPGTLSDFVGHGIIAGAGAVFIFVPQIFILFLAIGLLEDSGYLARAATLLDRPFSRVGLNGRSFVPILSGFACAVPAMLATRTIGSRKERWLTLFILPFMTCSARLPVYALLLSFLFAGSAPWKPGIALASIYLLSLVVGGLASAFLARMIKSEEKSFFLMELPYFRRPQIKFLLINALHRTKSYLRRAGPIIFMMAIAMWFATSYPKTQESATPSPMQDIEYSYLGQLGKTLEPVFSPLGADWRVGVSLLTAFAAREVFVSNLAIMLRADEEGDGEINSIRQGLIVKMSQARNAQGQPLFTLSSVLGLIVFFMLALQCTSTVAMAARESGSWSFAIGQLLAMNLLAYGVSVACVQGLRALGVA